MFLKWLTITMDCIIVFFMVMLMVRGDISSETQPVVVAIIIVMLFNIFNLIIPMVR